MSMETEALVKLAGEITQGPWQVNPDMVEHGCCWDTTISANVAMGAGNYGNDILIIAECEDGPNARAIALVPDLLAEVIKLRVDLAEARAGDDELAALANRARDIFLNCSVADGCCCCGASMDGHAEPINCGHIATDHGKYVADQWLTSSETIIASHAARKEKRG